MTHEKTLLIVESPSKAKTINKYLGDDYAVIASYGHVRDLAPKNGSVQPDDGFAMAWETSPRGKKQLQAITELSQNADKILLATDPDREGEAIAWHIHDILKNKRNFKGKEWKRIVFHEITKKAVTEALEKPRDINQDLVDSYMARRALDYLVGYTLSPVLWRKLPGARSAGRVQSAALRLVCEREMEIKRFNSQEYWSIHANIYHGSYIIETALSHIDGEKLDKMALKNDASCQVITNALQGQNATLNHIAEKSQKRNPAPPFSTSSLQQEASRKLGFSVTKTMQVAQKLYEGVSFKGSTAGLITYMRTDSVFLSPDAINASRDFIASQFGDAYVPSSPRLYKSKAKNTQEAHEAIRPTNVKNTPQSLRNTLDDDAYKLYTLIWNRTLASQMQSADILLTNMQFLSDDKKYTLSAHGHQIKFDGFLKLYREGRDDEEEEKTHILPNIARNTSCAIKEIEAKQHFTEPPPRFGEASLVKKMEEVGIGRPSTYASTLKLLQDREYLTLEKKRFTPSDKGMIVNGFLSSYYDDYFNYQFTANMEDSLDNVADGARAWKDLLQQFWQSFYQKTEESMQLTYDNVRQALDEFLHDYLFAHKEQKRKCTACDTGELHLQLGKYGPFIGCSNYPECQYRQSLDSQIANQDDGEGGANPNDYPKLLGQNTDGLDITLKKGPYGFYVEQALKEDADKKTKPKRASLNKSKAPDTLTLQEALHLLSLPRLVGQHPDDKQDIMANIGRFGPYLLWNKQFYSIPKDDDVYHIGMNRAVEVIAMQADKKAPATVLGQHPDGGDVSIKTGRYGPYVNHKKVNAPIPKNLSKDDITLEEAIELIANKSTTSKTGKTSKKSTAKKTSKKTAAKKTSTKKK